MENKTQQCSIVNNKEIPDMGNHLILDFNNVKFDLDNYELLDKKLREILAKTEVTIENACHKKFEPQGVTILYLLSESHFSIHTWPECGACAIDFFHCGPTSLKNLKTAEVELNNLFGWENCTSFLMLKRGSVSSYLTNDLYDKAEILKGVTFLHREQTPYQELRVYDTLAMGRILVLDGAVQFSSKWVGENDNYSIDMTRFNITKDKEYEHVIIIGGGDLIIAAHILEQYPLVKKLTVCDIDERVVECTEKYFSFADIIAKERKTGKLEVVISGGAEYMEGLLKNGKEGKVASVIIDCTDFALDEDSIAASLFTPKFYKNIYDLLEQGASFSQHITKIYFKDAFTERINKGGFGEPFIHNSQTPEYGGELPLAICKKN